MTELILLSLGTTGGMLLGVVVGTLRAKKHRDHVLNALQQAVVPVLERRAVALGIAPVTTQLGLSHDGELQIHHEDQLQRVVQLAQAIQSQESTTLGLADTMRVSKEEVHARLSHESQEKITGT